MAHVHVRHDEAELRTLPLDAHRHAAGRACAGEPWHDHRAAGGARGDAVDLDGRLAGEVRSVFRKYAAGQVHGGEFAGISRDAVAARTGAARKGGAHGRRAQKCPLFLHGRGKGRGAARHRLNAPRGQLHRARRPVGRRQVDGREAHRAILGCELGRDHGRRSECQGYAALSALGIRQLCYAG